MKTDHLDMDDDSGMVWVRTLDGVTEIDVECCGYVYLPHWPAACGSEPDWFGAEIEYLADRWHEDQRTGEAEWRAEQSWLRHHYDDDCVGRLR